MKTAWRFSGKMARMARRRDSEAGLAPASLWCVCGRLPTGAAEIEERDCDRTCIRHYTAWRPQTFADVIGQQHITDTLRAQLQSGRLSHAYLFTGTRGTGKTTCAKNPVPGGQLRKSGQRRPVQRMRGLPGILDGSVLDVTEIDAASNNGVDNIRDLRDETRYTPAQVKSGCSSSTRCICSRSARSTRCSKPSEETA